MTSVNANGKTDDGKDQKTTAVLTDLAVYGTLSKINYWPWSNMHSSVTEFAMNGRFPGFDFKACATYVYTLYTWLLNRVLIDFRLVYFHRDKLSADTLELVAAHVAAGIPISTSPEIVQASAAAAADNDGSGLCLPCVARTELDQTNIDHLDRVVRLVHTHWLKSLMKDGQVDLSACQKMFLPWQVVDAHISEKGKLVVTTDNLKSWSPAMDHYINWIEYRYAKSFYAKSNKAETDVDVSDGEDDAAQSNVLNAAAAAKTTDLANHSDTTAAAAGTALPLAGASGIATVRPNSPPITTTSIDAHEIAKFIKRNGNKQLFTTQFSLDVCHHTAAMRPDY